MAFSQKRPKSVNKNEKSWKEAFSNLKEYFGYTSFRTGQEAAIAAAFDRNDSLVVMATGSTLFRLVATHENVITVMTPGSGKSICYQVCTAV